MGHDVDKWGASEKASVLIEALPYVQTFARKLVVIKLGGSAMDTEEYLSCGMDDVAFLHAVGIRPVIVHGGGPAISAEMKRRGKEPVFSHGRRVTDDETMEIVEDVLVNTINRQIVDVLERHGCPARGLNYSNSAVLHGTKLAAIETGGDVVDLGRVGEVTSVNVAEILECTWERVVPVMTPISVDEAGRTLNVNADSAAAKVAAELGAAKLVFVSDTHGIYTDSQDTASMASSLREKEVTRLIRDGVIEGGMLPKVEGCLAAVRSGVGKAHIIDGRIKHSLLLEIFTDEGIGTEILL